jgi:hypothetical protein
MDPNFVQITVRCGKNNTLTKYTKYATLHKDEGKARPGQALRVPGG